ncbi:MAG: hypothetical protein ABMA26_18460, partial [Limisphaerales bacterium]
MKPVAEPIKPAPTASNTPMQTPVLLLAALSSRQGQSGLMRCASINKRLPCFTAFACLVFALFALPLP